MGGGPSSSDYNRSVSIEQGQSGIASTQQQNSQADRQQMLALEKPLIDKETALASGDRKAALSASMPTISKISQGYDAARQSIFNSVPAGAARDKALSELEVQKSTGIGTAQANEVQKAPEILASIGSGFGGLSMQEVGAALSGLSGAQSTNQDVLQSKEAEKANTMNMVSGIAGVAGTAAGAKFRK